MSSTHPEYYGFHYNKTEQEAGEQYKEDVHKGVTQYRWAASGHLGSTYGLRRHDKEACTAPVGWAVPQTQQALQHVFARKPGAQGWHHGLVQVLS